MHKTTNWIFYENMNTARKYQEDIGLQGQNLRHRFGEITYLILNA